MKRDIQHAILATIGIIAIRAAWGGLYLNFVKPGLRWWLLATGAVLLAMGIYGALTDDNAPTQGGQEGSETPHAHGAHHGPRIGWLLLVPFLIMSIVAPPPLGAFSAERDNGALRAAPAPALLPRLPATSAPVTMTLSEYSIRAVWEQGKTLTANRVRLVGFVSSRGQGTTGQSWYLTRMAMSCCAADSWAIKIDVRGGDRLPDDTWVAVTGSWVKSAGSIEAPDTLAAMQVESTQTVTKPAMPYEY